MVLEEFRRPGTEAVEGPRPKTIDEFGRSKGVGRRKSAVARVQLIEGDGQIIVNGKPLTAAFPRLHDRESVIWPLKITDRMEKYNAFVVASGGGSTGQAESITLGMANALIVHEPALKPILRMGKSQPSHTSKLVLTIPAGCVTRVMKRVERKKTGRVKARKRPAWVKR
jgi:small subunit ribosomal protein S9